jgi:hypothetical protein
MRRVQKRIAASLTIAILSACAADRVAGPAGTIGSDLSTLQSQLVAFSGDMEEWRSNQQSRTKAEIALQGIADEYVQKQQAQWALRGDAATPKLFATLQTQGTNAVARWNQPASAATPASAPVPVDKLAPAVSTVQELSKTPTTKADFDSLLAYGKQVSKTMKSLQTAAASAPITASAPHAASGTKNATH